MLFRSRFDERVQRNLDRMNTPHVVLQNFYQKVFYYAAWAPIDDASSRLNGSSLLYMGGTSSIIRTVIHVLTRKIFLGFDVKAFYELCQKYPEAKLEAIVRLPGKGWLDGRSLTVCMAHRGINRITYNENVRHFTLMLRNFDESTSTGGKAARCIEELYGPMYDTKSIIDSLRDLPQVIKLVANMRGMDSHSDTSLIPVGQYRHLYKKIQETNRFTKN